MGSGEAFEAMAALRAARDAFAATDLSRTTVTEKLDLYTEYEELTRQLPTESHRILAALQAETSPRELKAKTWNEVLRTRWRLSTTEAGRRLAEAQDLGQRHPVSGPQLPPRMPAMAAAQALGFITGEHVKLLRDALNNDLPHWVDAITRSQIEVELVRVAVGQGYEALRRAIRLRLAMLDQDGPDPEAVEKERRRKRGARKGQQGADGLTALTVNMDPETAAMVEVLFAKLAAPGMCNPDDPEPCYSGTPTRTQIDNDHRTLEQRQHDALKVVFRIVLMSDLGTLNGLPVSIIIRTTLEDLEGRGIAITGGGTIISMDDLDRLGGHAEYHLCVFDKATGSALNHFRAKRVATAAQRVMLIAQHGVGCTKPGCTVDAYGVQAHHAVKDWADDGNTNVDEMAPACGGDNNLVGPGGYTTDINDRGECEWAPPEHLDTGQDRTNIIHRPEALLAPHDDDTVALAAPAPAPSAPGLASIEDADDPYFLFGPPDPPTPQWVWNDDDPPPFDAAPPTPAPETDAVPDTPAVEPEGEPDAAAGPSHGSIATDPFYLFGPYDNPFASPEDEQPVSDSTVAEVHRVITDPDAPVPYALTDETALPVDTGPMARHADTDETDSFRMVLNDTAEAVGYGEPSRHVPPPNRNRPSGGPAPPA